MIEEPTTGFLGLTTIVHERRVSRERRRWRALGDKVVGLIAIMVILYAIFH